MYPDHAQHGQAHLMPSMMMLTLDMSTKSTASLLPNKDIPLPSWKGWRHWKQRTDLLQRTSLYHWWWRSLWWWLHKRVTLVVSKSSLQIVGVPSKYTSGFSPESIQHPSTPPNALFDKVWDPSIWAMVRGQNPQRRFGQLHICQWRCFAQERCASSVGFLNGLAFPHQHVELYLVTRQCPCTHPIALRSPRMTLSQPTWSHSGLVPKGCRKQSCCHWVLVAFQTQTQNRSVFAAQFPKSQPCPRW